MRLNQLKKKLNIMIKNRKFKLQTFNKLNIINIQFFNKII